MKLKKPICAMSEKDSRAMAAGHTAARAKKTTKKKATKKKTAGKPKAARKTTTKKAK